MNTCQAEHQRNKTSGSQNSPAGEGVLLRMPEDCLEGGLLSWEMERRGARPLLTAELLLWAGDGLVLTIDKKAQIVECLIFFHTFYRVAFKAI